MKLWKKNVILILMAVLIAVVPLIFLKDAAFEGADGQAEEAIGEIAPNYEPWFDSIIELPSGEVESLLFCVQAALGAGIMGFILGRITKKRNKRDQKLKIDEFAYSSSLVSTAPGIKLSLGVVVIFICLIGQSTAASCLTLVSMAALSLVYSAIRPGEYLRLLLVPLGFLMIGTVTVMVASYPLGHPMLLGWRIGERIYGIDEASLRMGINLALRAWAAVSCMYFMSLNTPIKDILYTLRKIHVPLVLVTLMELIYRYIFVLLDQARTMRTAQASRLGYETFRSSIQSTGQLIGALFLRTFQRCDAIYAALESRGYEGEMRMLPRQYRTNPRLILIMSFLIAATMALTLWERGIVG